LQLFFGNKNCPLLKFGKENIHKSGLMKLLACHTFSVNIYFEPDIRYPAKSVSGASLFITGNDAQQGKFGRENYNSSDK
jgi:hypothetical protein